MKSQKTKEQFIQLRAQGLSYVKITEELGICKATCVSWAKELAQEIANLKTINLDALYEQFGLSKTLRLEALGQQLQRLTKEINNRDLSTVQTDQLFKLMLMYLKQLDREIDGLQFQGIKPPTKLFDDIVVEDKWPA